MTIQSKVGPGEELYAMPSTKNKGKEENEARQKELTEEEKAAPHSVPDKKRVKIKNEGVSGH